jgi:hypothetical protein
MKSPIPDYAELERQIIEVMDSDRYADLTPGAMTELAQQFHVPVVLIRWCDLRLTLFELFDAAHAAKEDLDFELLHEELEVSEVDLLEIYGQWKKCRRS